MKPPMRSTVTDRSFLATSMIMRDVVGPGYLSTANIVTTSFMFAATTAVVVHTILYHGNDQVFPRATG